MNLMKHLTIIFMSLCVTACSPGVYVKQNPGRHNRGIRYYRPKPYLLLTPATTKEVATNTDGSTTSKTTDPSHQFVNIDLQYLPDFAEEYAINVRAGLGINNTQITLKDGWNLTQINQELDSQFDENLTALSEVLKAGASFSASKGRPEETRASVRATNVPIGYYESIINRGPDGKKRLYGWRYVGFAPFNSCPIDAGGSEQTCCSDGSLDIYGLTFESDDSNPSQPIMVFKKLSTLRGESTNAFDLYGIKANHSHPVNNSLSPFK